MTVTNKKPTIITAVLLLAISVSAQSAPEGITSGQQLQKQAESVTTDINTQALKKMLDDELEMVLIDIRTTDEVSNMGGTIDAIQNSVIPRGWLEFRASKVAQNKDTPIVVYCGAGIRSPLAAKTLQDMGYTNVKNYSAGFLGWRKAGLPIK
jgi:rhodanese-related sulfurtransferase